MQLGYGVIGDSGIEDLHDLGLLQFENISSFVNYEVSSLAILKLYQLWDLGRWPGEPGDGTGGPERGDLAACTIQMKRRRRQRSVLGR